MTNFSLRQAKQQMADFLNGLPFEIEVKRLLVKDLYEDIKAEADKIVLKELAEAQQALKEKKDGEDEGRT